MAGVQVLGFNYYTEMCSGSEAGSYLRLIDFVYHSALGLIQIKKKKFRAPAPERERERGCLGFRGCGLGSPCRSHIWARRGVQEVLH